MQHFWHWINSLSAHSSITASHSFGRFFYVIEESLINFHTHLFDQIFLKKDINHQYSIKNHFYIVNTCRFQRKISKITINQNFNKWSFQHFSKWLIFDHFEQSFHAIKTNKNSISFHFIYDQFFNFLFPFSNPAIKIQQNDRWCASNKRNYE